MVVLVRRGVGDVIWHLPTFRALARRSPQGKIVVAMRPTSRGQDLLKADPLIDHVVYLPYQKSVLADLWSHIRIFRRERPSGIWVMEKVVLPSLAAFLAGVPERHGFGMGARSQEMWLNAGPHMPRSSRRYHCLDKLNLFDQLNGLETDRAVTLPLEPEAVAAVSAKYAGLPRPWVVFGIGASEPFRMWPLERLAETAARLKDQIGTLFWFGSPAECKAMQVVLAGRYDQPNSVWFSGAFDEGAPLLSLADLFVGPDSGPLNVTGAVGTPALGLYGPSPQLTYSPWLHGVVSPDRTMEGLTVDQAVEAATALLNTRRKAS